MHQSQTIHNTGVWHLTGSYTSWPELVCKKSGSQRERQQLPRLRMIKWFYYFWPDTMISLIIYCLCNNSQPTDNYYQKLQMHWFFFHLKWVFFLIQCYLLCLFNLIYNCYSFQRFIFNIFSWRMCTIAHIQ